MLLVFLELLQEYHTGHIRMVNLNLTDAALGGQGVRPQAAALKRSASTWQRAGLG